jgi:hypothetical protein
MVKETTMVKQIIAGRALGKFVKARREGTAVDDIAEIKSAAEAEAKSAVSSEDSTQPLKLSDVAARNDPRQ